jgi:CarD family transcriptional regulator
MAQKMAPTKAASKKAVKKPSSRKEAHLAAPGAKATTKTKTNPKSRAASVPAKATAAAAKAHAQVKHVAKPAAQTRPQPVKLATQAKVHHPAKAPARREAKHEAKHEPVKPAVPAHKATAQKPSAPLPHKESAKAAPLPTPPPVARRPAVPGVARSMPAAVAKAASQKIIAPASPPPAAALQQPAVLRTADASALKKPVHQRHGFKVNEWIVYPAHGVGRIVAIEEQEIAGISLELFVITFEKDKMTLRVPTGKSESVGMRKLAEEPTVKKAMETLKGRARVKRTMWSRRAQEYEAKINSGDLIAIAEVVRDLYRSESQPEQSYSERQLYEAALDRMAREVAVVEKLDERGAVQRITEVLAKSARGRSVAAEAA